nr:exported hypothetical protein [Serratia symbiotica]
MHLDFELSVSLVSAANTSCASPNAFSAPSLHLTRETKAINNITFSYPIIAIIVRTDAIKDIFSRKAFYLNVPPYLLDIGGILVVVRELN